MRIWHVFVIVFATMALVGIVVFGLIFEEVVAFSIAISVQIFASVIAILISRAFEFRKYKENVLGEIDKAVKELSQIARLELKSSNEIYFESNNLSKFCQRIFKVVMEGTDYDLGIFETTDATLPQPFLNTYPNKDVIPTHLILNILKSIAMDSRGETIQIDEKAIIKQFNTYGFDEAKFKLPYKRAIIFPLGQDETNILGYFAFLSGKSKKFMHTIIEQKYPLRNLILELENKRIGDSFKIFVERQRRLLHIGLLRLLDIEVVEKILSKTINDSYVCGKKIVQILTKKLNLEIGFLYLRQDLLSAIKSSENPYIFQNIGQQNICKQIEQEFLLPFINASSERWSRSLIRENTMHTVRERSFDLEFVLTCPLGESSKGYGMIGFMAKREFNDFDLELIQSLDFKIHHCFLILEKF